VTFSSSVPSGKWYFLETPRARVAEMRILITAYACDPAMGSESGTGWRITSGVARHHEVHVITRSHGRRAIEAALKEDPTIRLRAHYLRPFEISKLKLGWIAYYLWQLRAALLARRLNRKFRFDLCHALNYASWRVPPFLWLLRIPFIWGPFGGGQNTPSGFSATLGVTGCIEDGARGLSQWASRFDPLIRLAMNRASRLICINSDTQRLVPPRMRSKVLRMFDVGVEIPQLSTRPDSDEITILWVGRIIPWKGLPLLIEAMALLPQHVRARAVVFGAGYDRGRCERLAKRVVPGKIIFHGEMPPERRLTMFEGADIFVFTSLHETSGTVVLEAMAAGLPVIMLDCGGNSEIADGRAIKVQVSDPKRVPRDIASEISKLYGNRQRMIEIGADARLFVSENHVWIKRIASVLSTYDEFVV